MRIDTRYGPIDTVRHVTTGLQADVLIIDETAPMPGVVPGQQGRRLVARQVVARELFAANPAGVEADIRRNIEGAIRRWEAEVGPQVDLVARPVPPAPLRELMAANPTDPLPIDFYTQVRPPRVNRLNAGNTYDFTWTATNLAGGEMAFRPHPAQEERVHPPIQTAAELAAERVAKCSCGHPDDPNWQHEHDECTFLDRPSSEWYDEGEA